MVYKVEGLAREAAEDPWPFEFDDEHYELPRDIDMRAAALLAAGNLEGGLRVLLGEEQWTRLCASPRVFRMVDLKGMLGAYTDAIGADMGESPASSRSSNDTATRSKPTSNATTTSSWPTSSLSQSA